MSARIAPEPINLSVAPAMDLRPRALPATVPEVPATKLNHDAVATPDRRGDPSGNPAPLLSDRMPPLPRPPAPPGTMFAAAVMAGALSPKPQTPQEILLRLGTAWVPPESSLHLADRTA